MVRSASLRDEPPVFLFTVDVEDWFQVENFKQWISFDSWGDRQLRVVDNTFRLLDCIDSAAGEGRLRGTFFVLGWLAERVPGLVKEIDARGHEVASHGYYHRMGPSCSDEELFEDLVSSRKCLEDILGKEVRGYRAPSFSIEPRLIRMLKQCGYCYDSSYNSFAGNGRYGTLNGVKEPVGGVITLPNGLYEFPVSNLTLFNRTVPWGGGGFFRLIPRWLYRLGVRARAEQSGAFVYYTHPWEIDPFQPRVKEASPGFKFRHYVNLHKCMDKLAYLLRHTRGMSFRTCSDHLNRTVQPSNTPRHNHGPPAGRQAM